MSGARYAQFNKDPVAGLREQAENARSTSGQLLERVVGFLYKVERHRARGVSTETIRIPRRRFPRNYLPSSVEAVMVARCFETQNESASAAVPGPCHFHFAGDDICVLEPSGLTAGKDYNLTFLIITE
jgi:hypothetical protein